MTQKEKIIKLLSDKHWHSTEELHAICWRYGARIHDLKREGCRFEKEKHPTKQKIELWRLVEAPQAIKIEHREFIPRIRMEKIGRHNQLTLGGI